MFTKQSSELFTDDELKDLQCEIIANPDIGDVIEGTGGLRKIRVKSKGRGKRGGSRVIYLLASEEVIFLMLAYPKSKKDDLAVNEKKAMKKIAEKIKEVYR